MSSRAEAVAGLIGVLGSCCSLGCSNLSISPVPPQDRLSDRVLTAEPQPAKFTSRQLDGSAFPDGVLALTWDDGPDAHTLELGEFLHERNIAATFFVVRQWERGLSDDPGEGRDVYQTGYAHIPILKQLVGLGHRIGNHTVNHRLLSRLVPTLAMEQLEANQTALEPFVFNDFRFFRVPGGDWNSELASHLNTRPSLANLTGPVRWDIDSKDWQSSVECLSPRPSIECEVHAGRLRTKASVVAARYLTAVERRGRGIVLLHDRVGDVGSSYSLEVARLLIPELQSRGFVFAAPVLRFAPLRPRNLTASPMFFDPAPSIEERPGSPEMRQCSVALTASPWVGLIHVEPRLADVNGDGRRDCCAVTPEGVLCSMANGSGFMAPEYWTDRANFGFSDSNSWFSHAAYYESLRLGDINGDGRADLCGRAVEGVTCALSTGRSFTQGTNWLRGGMTDSDGWLTRDPGNVRLADVNWDGRADLCVLDETDVYCGLAP